MTWTRHTWGHRGYKRNTCEKCGARRRLKRGPCGGWDWVYKATGADRWEVERPACGMAAPGPTPWRKVPSRARSRLVRRLKAELKTTARFADKQALAALIELALKPGSAGAS